MQLTQHPLSAAFPAMDEADYLALKDDIEDNGQREPVWVLDGMVLDGWHRYRACIELGIEPTKFQFQDDDPVAFVKSENFHRRHLTGSQRAAAILALSDYAAQGRKSKGATVAPLPKVAELAKQANVSPRTMKDASAAKKAGLLEPVKDGALTANEAAKIARGTGMDAKGATVAPLKSPDSTLEDFGPDADELEAQAKADKADAEWLQKLLDSDDKLATAHAEVKRLNAVIATLEVVRDGYMNGRNEAIKMVKRLQSRLDKLERATA